MSLLLVSRQETSKFLKGPYWVPFSWAREYQWLSVYTAEYTAVAGNNTVSIAAQSYADLTGNLGSASNTLNLAEANPPIVAIASLGGAIKW